MAYHLKITIDQSKVPSDQSNFPVLITEAGLPDHFWKHVASDGSDILVKNSAGTTLKRYVVLCETSSEKLVVRVRATLSSSVDTELYLYYGVGSYDNDLDVFDSTCKGYWPLANGGDGIDITGTNNLITEGTTADLGTLELAETGEPVLAHEGVAWDGEYYYVIHGNASEDGWLKKYDTEWNLIATNEDLHDETGLPEVSGYYRSIGDGDCYGGLLYVACRNLNTDPRTSINQRVCVWNTSDLSHVANYDISAQDNHISGIWVDGDNDRFYICSYDIDVDTIQTYRLSDMSYLSAENITLDVARTSMQGIVSDGVSWFIASQKRVRQADFDGSNNRGLYTFDEDDIEGITLLPETGQIAVLHDDDTASPVHSNSRVYVLEKYDGKFGRACDFVGGTRDYLVTDGTPSGMSGNEITLSAWADFDDLDPNNRLFSAAGGCDFIVKNDAGTYIMRFNRGAWISSNTFDDPKGTFHLFTVTYDSVADLVTFYLDGEAVGTSSDASGAINASGSLYLGRYYSSDTYHLNGRAHDFMLDMTERSADWILTKYNNESDPAEFYDIDFIDNIKIYRGVQSPDNIDYDVSVGSRYGSGNIDIPSLPHEIGVDYYYAARQTSVLDREEENLTKIVKFRLGDDGEMEADRPDHVYNLQAIPGAGGTIKLKFAHTIMAGTTPVQFNVIGGVSPTNMTTITGTVTYRGDGQYEWTSAALTDGTRYYFAVTAEDTDGEEDRYNLIASAEADNSKPSTISGAEYDTVL